MSPLLAQSGLGCLSSIPSSSSAGRPHRARPRPGLRLLSLLPASRQPPRSSFFYSPELLHLSPAARIKTPGLAALRLAVPVSTEGSGAQAVGRPPQQPHRLGLRQGIPSSLAARQQGRFGGGWHHAQGFGDFQRRLRRRRYRCLVLSRGGAKARRRQNCRARGFWRFTLPRGGCQGHKSWTGQGPGCLEASKGRRQLPRLRVSPIRSRLASRAASSGLESGDRGHQTLRPQLRRIQLAAEAIHIQGRLAHPSAQAGPRRIAGSCCFTQRVAASPSSRTRVEAALRAGGGSAGACAWRAQLAQHRAPPRGWTRRSLRTTTCRRHGIQSTRPIGVVQLPGSRMVPARVTRLRNSATGVITPVAAPPGPPEEAAAGGPPRRVLQGDRRSAGAFWVEAGIGLQAQVIELHHHRHRWRSELMPLLFPCREEGLHRRRFGAERGVGGDPEAGGRQPACSTPRRGPGGLGPQAASRPAGAGFSKELQSPCRHHAPIEADAGCRRKHLRWRVAKQRAPPRLARSAVDGAKVLSGSGLRRAPPATPAIVQLSRRRGHARIVPAHWVISSPDPARSPRLAARTSTPTLVSSGARALPSILKFRTPSASRCGGSPRGAADRAPSASRPYQACSSSLEKAFSRREAG